MACFVVPAVEAVVVTATYLAVKKKEVKLSLQKESGENTSSLTENKISFSKKLSRLSTMLWGGVFLLIIDHIWSGELVPYPPFFAAMSNPEDYAQMLYEIKTLGVLMSASITAFWGIACVASDALRKIKLRAVKSSAK